MSDNPLDYVSLVLYVKRGVPVCDRLLQDVAGHLDVAVQDIEAVPKRPEWLRGVPTCVRMPGGQVLVGTEAIKAVRDHCGRGPSSLEPCAGGCRAEAFAIAETQGQANYGAAKTEEAFSSESPPKPRRGRGNMDLEEFIRMRGK